jgi:hypothetical protein
MRRRILFTLFFLVFVTAAVWYASPFTRVPQVTFPQAATHNDESKKVLVVGKVSDRDIVPEGESVIFYMIDQEGNESRVQYDGSGPLTAGQLADARKGSRQISVAGHSHGEYFHATEVNFPAY